MAQSSRRASAEVGTSVQDMDHPGETPDASPIKPIGERPQVAIKSLKSVVKDTVLLEYTNGVLVRLALPKLYTSCLIDRCLRALKSSLLKNCKDACHSLFAEWYCIRNSPGPSSISNAQEWNMFAKCLMQLIGNQDKNVFFKPPHIAEVKFLKSRQMTTRFKNLVK